MPKVHSSTYEVNDFIIEYGKAFQITKIEKKNNQDKKKRIIHYRSYFPSEKNQRLYCTIPQSSLKIMGNRKPVSKKDARAILQSLAQSAEPITNEVLGDYEDVLKSNDIFQTSAMVKKYWSLKNDPEISFSNSKNTLYESGLERVTEELAVVFNHGIKDMRQKVLKALKKK